MNRKTLIKEKLAKIYEASIPDKEDLEFVLSIEKTDELGVLFDFANKVRQEFAGDGILLRGVVEFSNYCNNTCLYCGINKNNKTLNRYSMSFEEIIASCEAVVSGGIKTIVLQSGENTNLDPDWLRTLIIGIKSRSDVAITLSVGEEKRENYRLWKNAGADRYLLKIETTDRSLYEMLHPGMSFDNRIRCLDDLESLGYQVGSGIIVGLKGQSIESVADDIIFFKKRNFDMIGIGPFIPHPATPLVDSKRPEVNMVLKVLALTRIVTKNAHLPATTALGSMDKDYRADGLNCGANVLMPNFTPLKYKKLYEIYPGKRCINDLPGDCPRCMEGLAKSIFRYIDYSKGDSLKNKKVKTNV